MNQENAELRDRIFNGIATIERRTSEGHCKALAVQKP